MCLSGKLYSGADAHAWGLADRLCAPDDLVPQALALAAEIAANPDPQLRMIKELLTRNGTSTDLGAAQRLESEMLRRCWVSPEHREAVSAFGHGRAVYATKAFLCKAMARLAYDEGMLLDVASGGAIRRVQRRFPVRSAGDARVLL